MGKAAELYRKAAIQGHAKAQFQLAKFFDNGDDAKYRHNAACLYIKAAMQGHCEAQYKLGNCYYEGASYNLEKDIEKAIAWWTKAAEQGHHSAMNAINTVNYMTMENNKVKAALKLQKESDAGVKYKLTNKTVIHNGVTLFQIQALKEFSYARLSEEIDASGYFNITLNEAYIDSCHVKPGDFGGYIQSEKNLAQTGNAWVSENAKIFGEASISGNASVSGNALIYGNAKVSGSVQIFGDAKIYDSADVFGEAQAYDNAEIFGCATVYGEATISDEAKIYGHSKVYGTAEVGGSAKVHGYAVVSGDKNISNGEITG